MKYYCGTLKRSLFYTFLIILLLIVGRNITVNAIAPGLVPSNMSKQLENYVAWDKIVSTIPLGRAGSPSDMAAAALYFASVAGAWCTGVVLLVDGGALCGMSSVQAAAL